MGEGSSELQPQGAGLRGLGVVVTRPVDQAKDLSRMLHEAGARVIAFPLIEIETMADEDTALAVLGRLSCFDLAIFVSSNAVSRGLALVRRLGRWPPQLPAAAVGRATARELQREGLPPSIVPERRFDSEGLLAMRELQGDVLAGKRVVVFRGEGGRAVLADTLRARGATVEYAEVYRRVRSRSNPARLLARWRRGEVDAVMVTSAQALRDLFKLLSEPAAGWFEHVQLVVISPRLGELARGLGYPRPPLVAAQASDQALVDALWR